MFIQPDTRLSAPRGRFGWLAVPLLLLTIEMAPRAGAQCPPPPREGAAAGPATAQETFPGATVFAQHCAVCHGEQGEGRSALITIAGPPLLAEHDGNHVLEAIRDGRGVMPGFEKTLRAAEIRNVAQYVTGHLATIPLAGGKVGEGGELYRMYCAACHRTAVRGGALAFVGTNAPELTDKSPAVVAATIRWGPGPMPAFPKSVLNDQQVASIVDYVGVVQHPPNPGGRAMHWYGPVSEGFAAWVFVFVLGGLTMWIEKGGKG